MDHLEGAGLQQTDRVDFDRRVHPRYTKTRLIPSR
jgi:hypothetical protein